MPSSTDYEAVIGLKVQVQLRTNTKMFRGCKNEFGGASNSRVCPDPTEVRLISSKEVLAPS